MFHFVSGFFKAQDVTIEDCHSSKVSLTWPVGIDCYLLGNASLLAGSPGLTKVHAEHQCDLGSAMDQVAGRDMIKPDCNVLNVLDVYTSRALLF